MHSFTERKAGCVVAGAEHEHKLNKMLADAGIAFWTEDDLRNKGFFKTPDAKLQVCSHVLKCLPDCMCRIAPFNTAVTVCLPVSPRICLPVSPRICLPVSPRICLPGCPAS